MCKNLHYESVYFKELHSEHRVLLTSNIQSGGSCSVNYYYSIFIWNYQAIRKTGMASQLSGCGFLGIEGSRSR